MSNLALTLCCPAVSRHRVMLSELWAIASPRACQSASTASTAAESAASEPGRLLPPRPTTAASSWSLAAMVLSSSASTCASTASRLRVTGSALAGFGGEAPSTGTSPRVSPARPAESLAGAMPSSATAAPAPVASSQAGRYSFQAMAAADSTTVRKAVLTRFIATGGRELASASEQALAATSWNCLYSAWPSAFDCLRWSLIASRRPARRWGTEPTSWLRPTTWSRAWRKAGWDCSSN
mmetsp:Transcript_4706/g.14729  ORF Transcript_4706/g.14729 Transcript_4706/m.14729 type:complete len:238 (-) Transcript_4706:702-1415(-)